MRRAGSRPAGVFEWIPGSCCALAIGKPPRHDIPGCGERSRVDETVSKGYQRQLGLIQDAELLLDMFKMRADASRGRIEIQGDALHRRATGQTDEHLEFSLRQSLDRRL